MAKTYVLTAPAALINMEGSLAHLMLKGAAIPDGVDPVQLQHLIDTDMVAEGDPVGGLPVAIPDVPVIPAEVDEAKPGPKNTARR